VTRHNNFDALRLLAATAVIFSHAIFLATGRLDIEPLMVLTGGQTSLGVVGVFVFFVISGYLVTQSWEQTGSLPRYLAKRGLRLYPGLAVCILVLTFGLGPLVTSLPPAEYFSAYDTWDFLIANLLVNTDHNSLPGVWFTGGDIGHIVNGPLWSLPVEMVMYLLVAALGQLRLMRLPVLAVLIAVGVVCLWFDTTTYYEFIGSVGWMLAFFVMGMALYKLRDRGIFNGRLALLALAGLVVTVPLGAFLLLFPVFGGYLVLYLALNPALPVMSAARFGDLSYGLYIYGWPVEQTVLYLRPGTGWPALFFIALPVTAVVAFLSWHLVEKRALAWKPRGPAQAAGIVQGRAQPVMPV
jgi:peptidoglycan/LPS O-acetylase OafA/YrhL